MGPTLGAILPFAEYLAQNRRKRPSSVIWRWSDLEEAIARARHGERGTIALADPNSADPATIAPGLSAAVQIVKHGDRTAPHAHSFWHLYFVHSGSGLVLVDEDATGTPIGAGDCVFIPAWSSHAFANAGREPLVLFALQNLPLMAGIGSLARKEADGSVAVVYAG